MELRKVLLTKNYEVALKTIFALVPWAYSTNHICSFATQGAKVSTQLSTIRELGKLYITVTGKK
jgi:hypothetical protein